MAPDRHDDVDAQDPELRALGALRALPLREIDPRVDARVLRAARAVLAEEPRRGVVHLVQLLWARAVAPALVTATVASYLVWAAQSAGALYR